LNFRLILSVYQIELVLRQTASGHNPLLAALAVIGIATIAGAVGGAIGYTAATLATGEKFDNTSFAVATIGGGLTTGAATTVALLGGRPVGFLATMATGNMIQYGVDRKLHGDPVDPFKLDDQIMLGGSFAIGALGGAIGGQTTSSFVTGGLRSMALEFGKQSMTQTAKNATRMFMQELVDEMAISSVKSAAATIFSSFSTKIVELTN
jgi:hypothetical protein